MQELLQRLRDIELKIKTLGERYETLKQQNTQLKQENISLKQDLEQAAKEQSVLIRDMESAKSQIVQHKHLDDEKEAIRKQLGVYIREVDKCIGMMQEIG